VTLHRSGEQPLVGLPLGHHVGLVYGQRGVGGTEPPDGHLAGRDTDTLTRVDEEYQRFAMVLVYPFLVELCTGLRSFLSGAGTLAEKLVTGRGAARRPECD